MDLILAGIESFARRLAIASRIPTPRAHPVYECLVTVSNELKNKGGIAEEGSVGRFAATWVLRVVSCESERGSAISVWAGVSPVVRPVVILRAGVIEAFPCFRGAGKWVVPSAPSARFRSQLLPRALPRATAGAANNIFGPARGFFVPFNAPLLGLV